MQNLIQTYGKHETINTHVLIVNGFVYISRADLDSKVHSSIRESLELTL